MLFWLFMSGGVIVSLATKHFIAYLFALLLSVACCRVVGAPLTYKFGWTEEPYLTWKDLKEILVNASLIFLALMSI